MKKVFIILLSFLSLTSTSNNTSQTGLIAIQYWGDIDKPYPLTILYLPGTDIRHIDFVDTIGFFVYQTQITEQEFDDISELIESSNFKSKIDSLPWSIIFTVRTNNEKKFYETQNQFLIKEILDKIIIQVNSPDKNKTVKYPLEILMRRLGIINK